jgi:hypothetical protein
MSLLLAGGAAPAETITVDKWFKQHENPVRKFVATAVVASSLFFVPVVAQPETITVDKWYQPISQPFKQPLRKVDFGEFRFELPRTILVSDWFQPAVQPSNKIRLRQTGGV